MGRPRTTNRGGAAWRFCRLCPLPLALLLLSGCQQSPSRLAVYPDEVRFTAAVDSLGLADYLNLTTAQRRRRDEMAAHWLAQAKAAALPTRALQALHAAVGVNPASAEAWLRLAELRRWFGEYQQVEDALAACRAALPQQTVLRRSLAAEAAICEAWLRYDRGEWRRGLAMVDTARAYGATGEAVELLRALHLAGLGHENRAKEIALRFAGRHHFAHWIHGVAYWRRGGVQAAHSVFTGQASEVMSGTADFVKGQMRPATLGAAECYRDFGTVEELLGNWWLAGHNYRYSASAVPLQDPTALRRVEYPNLEGGPPGAGMPVWLAFDRYFVTGSLSAFTALALHRFERADTAPERDFWASAVLDAAGICVRLDLHTAWARRARGLVLEAFQGQQERARLDLEAAQRWFDMRRLEDLRTLATLGRLHLAAGHPAEALPLLLRATRLAPDQARLWSDLGLSYVNLGALDKAMAALSQAIELDENLAVAWYNRGLLRWHRDDLPGALADLERAHVLAPADPEIAGLRERLRELRSQRR